MEYQTASISLLARGALTNPEPTRELLSAAAAVAPLDPRVRSSFEALLAFEQRMLADFGRSGIDHRAPRGTQLADSICRRIVFVVQAQPKSEAPSGDPIDSLFPQDQSQTRALFSWFNPSTLQNSWMQDRDSIPRTSIHAAYCIKHPGKSQRHLVRALVSFEESEGTWLIPDTEIDRNYRGRGLLLRSKSEFAGVVITCELTSPSAALKADSNGRVLLTPIQFHMHAARPVIASELEKLAQWHGEGYFAPIARLAVHEAMAKERRTTIEEILAAKGDEPEMRFAPKVVSPLTKRYGLDLSRIAFDVELNDGKRELHFGYNTKSWELSWLCTERIPEREPLQRVNRAERSEGEIGQTLADTVHRVAAEAERRVDALPLSALVRRVKEEWRAQRMLELLNESEQGTLHIDSLGEQVGKTRARLLGVYSELDTLLNLRLATKTELGICAITERGREVLSKLSAPGRLAEEDLEQLRRHPASLRILATIVREAPYGQDLPVTRIVELTGLDFKYISTRASALLNMRLIETRGASYQQRVYFLSQRGVRDIAALRELCGVTSELE